MTLEIGSRGPILDAARRRSVLAGVEPLLSPVLQSDREGTPWPS
jgi:hypothetical protein